MLEVDFYNVALKKLKAMKKTDAKHLNLILSKIEDLRINPFLYDTKKLASYNQLYRVKVSNYRIIYKIENSILVIVMIDIRAKIYEALKRFYK